MVKVGKLTGSNIIFTGSYLVSKNNIRVIARLINVETGKTESSARLTALSKISSDLQDKVVLTLLSETTKVTIPDVKQVRIAEAEKKKYRKNQNRTPLPMNYMPRVWKSMKQTQEALSYFTKALEIDRNYILHFFKPDSLPVIR